METFIHPTAVIDRGALIGKGVHIWHFCHLMPGCKLGDDCNLGQNVFIDADVQLGHGVKVQNNVSVYRGVILEEEVFVGPSVVFTNVLNPRAFINRKAEIRKTLVHRGATIGANATVICGVEIGEYALIGAGSVVTKNILPFSLVTGNPARQVGWVSEGGMRLKFNSNPGVAICSMSGEQYILQDKRVVKSI